MQSATAQRFRQPKPGRAMQANPSESRAHAEHTLQRAVEEEERQHMKLQRIEQQAAQQLRQAQTAANASEAHALSAQRQQQHAVQREAWERSELQRAEQDAASSLAMANKSESQLHSARSEKKHAE